MRSWKRYGARAAVRQSSPLSLQLLNHADAEVRNGAAAVLAHFPEESERSRLALQERLKVVDDQEDRAQLSFSLGALLPHQSERLELYAKALAKDAGRWTQAKVAMTLIDCFGAVAPGEAITVLMSALPGVLNCSAGATA